MDKNSLIVAYCLLDALYLGEAEAAETAFCVLYENVEDRELLECLDALAAKGDASLRRMNMLRAPLIEYILKCLKSFEIKLYGALKIEHLKSGFVLRDVGDALSCEKNVNILITNEAVCPLPNGIDMAFTLKGILTRANYCMPVNYFDYSRLFLLSKFNCPLKENVSIAICGSSYASVGLITDLMPRLSVNLGADSQDPYYAILSARRITEVYKGIDTIVIMGGFYFWHTDMSDNPSDYLRSVLTKVNVPVFGDRHNYKEEVLNVETRAHTDPLLEVFYDFNAEYNNCTAYLMEQISVLPFFNGAFFPRPEHGMLKYPFREKTDGINSAAAKHRADAHNGNYNLSHLADNLQVLESFLSEMNERNISVTVIIPPTTDFYKNHVDRRLVDSTLKGLNGINHKFTLINLFDGTDFVIEDFLDYDHFNKQGAIKFSKYISGLI